MMMTLLPHGLFRLLLIQHCSNAGRTVSCITYYTVCLVCDYKLLWHVVQTITVIISVLIIMYYYSIRLHY